MEAREADLLLVKRYPRQIVLDGIGGTKKACKI